MAYFFAAALLLASPDASQGKPKRIIEWPLVTHGAGGKITVVLTRTDLEASPSWSPTGGPPPVSMVEACQMGDTFIKSKGFPAATIDSISLVRFQDLDPALQGKWYYRVHFVDAPKSGLRNSPFKTMVILMDRKILEAREGEFPLKYE